MGEGTAMQKLWCAAFEGFCLAIMVSFALTTQAAAATKEPIVLGGECDRTGPTQLVGVNLCPGMHDYVKLVNKKGGIMGHAVKFLEIEHGYEVPRAVEAYETLKGQGAVAMLDYGTPIVYALTPRHLNDKIPGITPGFGRADSADGQRFPYVFPLAASYWSQGAAAMKFVLDEWTQGGKQPKDLKLAYVYYDNPAGREPIPTLERLVKKEGVQMRTFAVPPPGLEMSAAALDIARRYRADWVITHLFGRSPSVSIKELNKVGFPMNRVLSLVWGAAEVDIDAAGWDIAQGYLGMQFAGVGQDFPVIQEIIAMYQEEGQEPPAALQKVSVYYNRGVFNAALLVEAVRLALEKSGESLTGQQVKQGFESIRDFTLGGLVPPMEVTPQDHEGGGWVRIYRVQGKQWVPATDWFTGYRDVVWDLIKEAAAKGE
jgi:branched-chain amino acid transport system substrate-binding protein